MAWMLSPQSLLAITSADAELGYRLQTFDGVIRVGIAETQVDLIVSAGQITTAPATENPARVTLSWPAGMLERAAQPTPPPLHQGVIVTQYGGATIAGDMARDVAPYVGGLDRLFNLLRIAHGGAAKVALPHNSDLFSDTDTAVGRYLTVTVDGVRYRIFYEVAGTGKQALLLQHTAGGDARQWRHQLADPEFQQRFRVIAYDLPFHGRSLPPTGEDWWTRPYQPTEQWLMKIVLAIADGLELDKPVFMGCSLGGQLALDLAAHHGARFGGFVALNGTLDYPAGRDDQWNDLCRHPQITNDLFSFANLGTTSPFAADALRRELCWIYQTNGAGIYAADNDYFMAHDLKPAGHLIDGERTPTYLRAGEYDPLAVRHDHGGPAVAARFPSVDYCEMKGLSHFAPTDDPLGFRKAILPVLDEIIERQAARLTDLQFL